MQNGRLLVLAAAVCGLLAPVGGALLTAAPVLAADAERAITYRPRDGATKATRVTGAPRGSVDAPANTTPAITVLAPEDTGQTALAQPTLLWFAPVAIAAAAVEVAITDEITRRTVFETTLEGSVEAGVAAMPPGRLRVSLRTDRDYRWSVTVVRDPAQRSLDLFTSGTIRRADMPSAMAAQLNRLPAADMPYFLAENGLWYDALAVLTAQIGRKPDDRRLRNLRASLLEQAGLTDAAAYDRR